MYMDRNIMIKRSWTEIDLGQLIKNYYIYKTQLPSDTEIMAVVKADAYGHGDVQCALALQEAGVSFFAVATVKEAILLRENGINAEILVLGYTPMEFAWVLAEYDITQTLISEEYAERLAETSKTRIKCQFAINTGMNRIGLDGTDVKKCAELIHKYSEVFDLNGIFTHLCAADSECDSDVEFTKNQISCFDEIVHSLGDIKLKYIHCMNSAGGLFYSFSSAGAAKDIVRLGIILYGLKPDINNRLPEGIKPVLSWKTVVSAVNTVRAGESIGYGRSYVAQNDMRVATIPTGYADGYSRHLSNKGYVLIRGKRAQIVGRVCMDQMMVDVSDIPEAAMEDEVVLLGVSGEEVLTADDLAAIAGTIGYEIVCGISKRIERYILK